MESMEKRQDRPAKMPWVVPVYCDGCASCVNRCPLHGLEMVETKIAGVFVPWLSEPGICIGCGRCAEACSMGAICMTTFVERAVERFQMKNPFVSM